MRMENTENCIWTFGWIPLYTSNSVCCFIGWECYWRLVADNLVWLQQLHSFEYHFSFVLGNEEAMSRNFISHTISFRCQLSALHCHFVLFCHCLHIPADVQNH